MTTRRSRLLLPAVIASLAQACGDGPAAPSHAPRFRLLTDFVVPFAPRGIAVSPDGEHLVVTAAAAGLVSVYRGAQYLDAGPPLVLEGASGVSFIAGGSMAFVTTVSFGGSSVMMGLEPPTPIREARVQGWQVVGHEAISEVFVATGFPGAFGSTVQVIRSDGTLGPSQPIHRIRSIALTPEGDRLLVLVHRSPAPSRLHVLRASDLTSAAPPIDLPLAAEVVVPLADGRRAVVVGRRAHGNGRTGPLWTAEVDLNQSRADEFVIELREDADDWLAFGMGSPWAALGELAFVPSTQGLVLVDLQSGAVSLAGPEAFDDEIACCEVAVDQGRQRILIADHEGRKGSSGRVAAYVVQ